MTIHGIETGNDWIYKSDSTSDPYRFILKDRIISFGNFFKQLLISYLMDKQRYFLEIFTKVRKKYSKDTKRLAAEGWDADWQVLIVTIMSAQSRDETTIPIGERLFRRYGTLKKLSSASQRDVLRIFSGLNYNRTKARNVIAAAKFIISEFKGEIPEDIEALVRIPGVGRKTANLVLWEVHKKQGICVDTHVHRISNVLGLVRTKNPAETEMELMKIVPRKFWGKLNRYFVLWGKEVPGHSKKRLLEKLET